MGQALIAEHERVSSVSYVLPNKHYIPVDMKYLGIENTKE
jgi:urate oxidase